MKLIENTRLVWSKGMLMITPDSLGSMLKKQEVHHG